MKSRRIASWELLKKLSKEELVELADFVACPLFNKDKTVGKVLDELSRLIDVNEDFSAENQRIVYENVFTYLPKPNDILEKKQRSLLNVKLNILLRLTEKYLIIKSLETDSMVQSELLYDQLIERGQYHLFNQHMKKTENASREQSAKGEKYYENEYRIQRKALKYLNRTGQLLERDNLTELLESLDTYYLQSKLGLYLTAYSLLQKNHHKSYDFSSLKAIRSLLDLPQYCSSPILILYQANIELMQTEEEASYVRLLKLLDKYTEFVPRQELRGFYTNLTSYRAYRISMGQSDGLPNIFDLYKIMHDKNLLLEGDFIQIHQLKNIITVASQLGEYAWAEEIISHYRPFIHKEIRESVSNFYLGAIAFYQKKFDEAHSHFIQVDKINLTYDINVRVLIMKCLYEKEKEYSEPTVQAFRTAERYFSNHKSLTTPRKRSYKNFIQILINLYRMRHHATKKNVPKLKEKLETQKVNADKRWLMEKIAEL